jgi:hypothetical protein
LPGERLSPADGCKLAKTVEGVKENDDDEGSYI